jgi:hypothetical protein
VLAILHLALLLAAVTAPDGGAPTVDNRPRPSLLAPLGDRARPGSDDVYKLTRAKDGSGELTYDAAGFTARVARDGSVTFHDKGFGLKLLPLLRTRALRPPVMGVPSLFSVIQNGGRLEPTAPLDVQQDAANNYGAHLPIPTLTPYRPDPREACMYPRPCFFDAQTLLLTADATLDLTDEVMRLAGQDPYRYDKARFLTGTRELRTRLAARAHADDLRGSMADLPRRLTAIQCDDRLSAADRRAILRQLRAELDPTTDEGRAAAATIDRFVDRFVTGADRPDAGLICPPH